MGGPGSGSWYRWNKKTTLEEVKRIDIRYMRKQGLLKPSTIGTLSWTCGGEPSGDIRYTCYQHELWLYYRYRQNGGEWQHVAQRIPLDSTPCNYGGGRQWFRCPRCSKRVAVLYGADVLFLCRYCYKLPYASQNQGYMEKLINQMQKLREHIFEYDECGDACGKKKGMHWRTFERCHQRYQALEHLYSVGLSQRFPYLEDTTLLNNF